MGRASHNLRCSLNQKFEVKENEIPNHSFTLGCRLCHLAPGTPCNRRCLVLGDTKRTLGQSKEPVQPVGVQFGHLNSGQSATAYGGKTGCSVATRSTGGTVEPWHMLRLRPTSHSDGQQGSVLVMPPPRRALRHALPVVLEGVLGPLIVFYLLLVLAGFRGALIAALTWSYIALGRRLLKRERVSMLLLFGTVLLTLRTVVAFVTGSAFLYFAQPTAGTVAISVALLVSAMVGRPFTQRFAHDFCPMDPRS